NRLISALQTSPYCLVTRAQPAARASITSTCHPILPGRAVHGPAVARRRRRPGRNAALLPARLATAHHGRPGLGAGRQRRGAVTGTVASGDHAIRRPPPESLNAIGDARIDCFEHFW